MEEGKTWRFVMEDHAALVEARKPVGPGARQFKSKKRPGARCQQAAGTTRMGRKEDRSGDFFGETALISEDKRSANAKALEDSLVIAFFRSDLLEIIRRSPVFGTKILFNLSNIMATRLKRTNKLLQETNPNFNESKYS